MLRACAPHRRVEYTSVQRGRPDARHERGFTDEGDRFVYRLAVEFGPRTGVRGVVDRRLVRRIVARTLQRTEGATGLGQRPKVMRATRSTPPSSAARGEEKEEKRTWRRRTDLREALGLTSEAAPE
jgi:hypothetical protein